MMSWFNSLGQPKGDWTQDVRSSDYMGKKSGWDWNVLSNALGRATERSSNPPRDPNSPYDQEIAPLGALGSRYDGLMDMLTRLWR